MNKNSSGLTRSEIMSRVHSKDTTSELLLRKLLWSKGLRYRKNYKKVFGTPDIVFVSKKIAIFCDSEFWHGKDYLNNTNIPKSNTEYWINKFQKNILRDKEVNQKLLNDGWTVLRFWEKDILKDPEKCLKKIIDTFTKQSSKSLTNNKK